MVYAMFIFTMSRTRCLLLGMLHNFPPQSISAHQMTTMALNVSLRASNCKSVHPFDLFNSQNLIKHGFHVFSRRDFISLAKMMN